MLTVGVLAGSLLPFVSASLAVMTLWVCGMGAIQQRVEVVRVAWVAGACAIMASASVAQTPGGSPIVAGGVVVSPESIKFAAIVCAFGMFVQFMTILAEGVHRPILQNFGSVSLAGIAGSMTTMILQDQFKSPFVAIGFGVGVAYVGGSAVLKKLGANGLAGIHSASKGK